MIPMKHSSIFKSRWMALVWAAGILWFAYDFAAPTAQDSSSPTANAEQPADAAGAPITPDQERQLNHAIDAL